MIALDTETTGLDLRHAARPFFVALFDGERHTYWEWDVDPLSREVRTPDADVQDLCSYLEDEGEPVPVVGHNFKFDATALEPLGVTGWRWEVVEDTLLASHLLASNQPHDLTSLAVDWLGAHLQPLEDRLEEAVQAGRRRVQQARAARRRGAPKPPRENVLADWAVAEAGVPGMPSAGKAKDWKADGWLPRALALHDGLPAPEPGCPHAWKAVRGTRWKRVKGNRWKEAEDGKAFEACSSCGGRREHVVLREYGLADPEATWHLWREMRTELEARGQFAIYRERVKALPWLMAMERRGTTENVEVLREVSKECALESGRLEREMVRIAADRGHVLKLPKTGRNHNLDQFVFGWGTARCSTCGREQEMDPRDVEKINARRPACNFCAAENRVGVVTAEGGNGLNLERVYDPKAKTSKPALDAKLAIPHWLETLEPGSEELAFVKAFERRGRMEKAIGYCDSYFKFGLPLIGPDGRPVPRWMVLHPTFNAAGTQLLRRSCSAPNLQQVGKKKETNLRRGFGPAPGREWWTLDYKNLELRLPAYRCQEKELMDLFERADDPPYYGSEHLLNFSTIYPDVWEDALARLTAELGSRDLAFRQVGPWCKKEYEDTWYQWCKNFDFAVGYGAVDRPGGTGTADRAARRAGSQARVNSRFARKAEYNRKVVDFARRHGYVETYPDREVCPDRGYRLMVTRTERNEVLPTVPLNFETQGTAGWIQLKSMNRCGPVLERWTEEDPRGFFLIMEVHDELVFDFPAGTGPEPWRTNLPRVRVLQGLMEKGGEDVGVPLPVDVEWCPVNWADGVTIKKGAEDAPVKEVEPTKPVKLTGPGAFLASRRREDAVAREEAVPVRRGPRPVKRASAF